MSKKGQFLTSMRFISIFKTLGLIIIGFIMLLYALSTAQIDRDITQKLLYKIYGEQLINNPVCFAYEDEDSKKVMQGIIDINKLTQERLESCLTFGTKPPIRLRPAQATLIISQQEKLQINTTQWRQAYSQTTTKTYPVYIQQEQLTPAMLFISFNPLEKRVTT